MKSYQVKNTKPATSWTKGTTTSQYQSKATISQSGKANAPTTTINKRQSAQTNKQNPSSNLSSNTQKSKYQIQPQSRTINKPIINTNINNGNKKAYIPNNLSKNEQKFNYQNNRGERVGATETKVETKQEGDYLIKITTTRKVIDKDPSGYGTKGSYIRGIK